MLASYALSIKSRLNTNIYLNQGVFAYGQAYVALSRVRSRDGLRLETPLEARSIMVHPKVVQYYKDLLQFKKATEGHKVMGL